jgi:integrase
MLAAANAGIRLACALLRYTAQRPADTLSTTWGRIQDRNGRLWLTPRQAKTGEFVDVPANGDLETMPRGYRSTRNLKAMVYLIAGKLDLRLPT